MKLRAGFSLRWLAALAITAVPLCAQIPPSPSTSGPTIKVEVRVVLLDVVVINDNGDPVSGLSQDQFEVLEDGARQTVSSFEEHGRRGPAHPVPPGLAPPQAQTSAQGPLPVNSYTSSQTIKASDSVNVLLLDWLNTQPADQTYVRKQVVKYLHTVPPGTRLAIFTLGTELRLVQGFTTESSVILAALNNREAGASPKSVGLLDSKTREASEQEIIEMLIRNDAAPAAVSAVQDSIRESAALQTGDRVKLTIQGLLELQRYLAPIPGRKNVFWFSGSFPINNVPVLGASANSSNDAQSTSQGLGPARIAIYPISAEGVMTAGTVLMDPSQGLTTRARATDLNSAGNTNDSAKQIAMESIARETGGQAFYNTNGLDREITRAVAEGEHYYTMSYSPTNVARDGKFRNIHVKLAKGNYRLSYRRGYFSEAGPELTTTPPSQNVLLDLMRFGMPDFDQIVYNVHVTPEDPQPPSGSAPAGVNRDLKGPVTRYRVDFSIPLSELKLTGDAGGTMHGAVQLMLVAYQKNGYPLNLVESKNEFNLKREVYETARNVNIHARQELDVPAGDVHLRVGLFEQASGHVGTIAVPLLPAAGPSKN